MLVNVIMYLFSKKAFGFQKRQILHSVCANIFIVIIYKKGGGLPIEKVIYGDVLMVINFSMDYLALYITSKLMHIKTKTKKLTLSAIIGAVYSLVILSLNLNGILSGIISLTAAFVLTLTAYGKLPPKALLTNTAVFYVVNFALGGGITAICNLLNIWQNKRNIMINGTFDVLYGDLPFGLLIALAFICGIISLVFGKIIKRKSAEKVCELEILFENTPATLTGLIDSGNLLREPISGKPVIIVAFEAVRRHLPVELLPLFKENNTACLSSSPLTSGLRVIPASTVNSKGLLFALTPKTVKIDGVEKDVYTAITPHTESFGGFPAIVPNELIQ